MTARWEAVICAESAHIHIDEGGAPERSAGLKLLTVPTPDGKLTPELIDRQAWGFGDEHRAQPQVVSITQTTELGTLYTPEEITAVCDHAHELGMVVHLDGARLANAAAALDVPLRAFTTDAGRGRAVLRRHQERADVRRGRRGAQPRARSRGLPLPAQDRPCSSPPRCGSSRRSSRRCSRATCGCATPATPTRWPRGSPTAVRDDRPASRSPRPAQANAVFAILPADVTERLQKRFRFYTWNEATGEVRWMSAFDTTEADVDAFAAALAEEMDASA